MIMAGIVCSIAVDMLQYVGTVTEAASNNVELGELLVSLKDVSLVMMRQPNLSIWWYVLNLVPRVERACVIASLIIMGIIVVCSPLLSYKIVHPQCGCKVTRFYPGLLFMVLPLAIPYIPLQAALLITFTAGVNLLVALPLTSYREGAARTCLVLVGYTGAILYPILLSTWHTGGANSNYVWACSLVFNGSLVVFGYSLITPVGQTQEQLARAEALKQRKLEMRRENEIRKAQKAVMKEERKREKEASIQREREMLDRAEREAEAEKERERERETEPEAEKESDMETDREAVEATQRVAEPAVAAVE
ncbi:hypothetical protein KIPB_011295 [Kipferlia bialata]|uniref:Uncharacterized protein n=1 Tax=Kipferlia bialata TaxID=797122 RepID=A0A9K3D7T9_9EUKA|nr:hypothetical protein KIPB_011295 [Kipferlia bialata]|eukprot:g11295.t1